MVAVTAAVCTAPPHALADTPPPVSFDAHDDFNTDAVGTGLGANPWNVAVGDVNGDGKTDLVLPNLHRDEISVMLGGGDGTFTRSSGTIPSGPNTGAVALADFNSDGYLDIAATNGGDNTVSVYLGAGGGVFGTRTTYSVGAQDVFNQSVAVSDLNGDHVADLIVADSGGATVSVLLGDGSGGFGAAVATTVGAHPQSVATEYNSVTAQLGIAVAAADANEVDVIPVNSDGTLGSATSYPVGSEPSSVRAAYLNGDDIADLIVGNYGDGTVSVLIGQADGTFADAVTYPSATGSAPESVTVDDLNGDGFPDVAVANGDAASGADAGVSVLLGDGTGGLADAQDFSVGRGPLGIAAADLDGDGYPDLITANASDDTVSVLHNTTGASSGGGGTAPAIPPHQAVVGVQVDGDPDGEIGVADLDTQQFDDSASIGVARSPILSPDGTMLAAWADDDDGDCAASVDLQLITLASGLRKGVTDGQTTETMICPSFLGSFEPDQGQLGLAWAPDGESLYYDDPEDSSIHQVNIDGGDDTKIVPIPKDEDGDALAYPVVDPKDGSLWVALPDNGQYTTTGILQRPDHQAGIYQVIDDGSPHLAAEPTVAEPAIWPAFSPDGDVLAWITNGLEDSYDWYGSLRSRDMTTGDVTTVDEPQQAQGGDGWQWVLPNLIQVAHVADGAAAGTYFGYLGFRNTGEGTQPSYLRTMLGANDSAASTANDWHKAGVVAYFAGEIGGLTPPALPQDDDAEDKPGTDVTVDVLDNDLGPVDPSTLTLVNDDGDASVTTAGARPEIVVSLDANATDSVQVPYRVCAEAGDVDGGGGDGGDSPGTGCATATLTVDPVQGIPGIGVDIAGPATVPADGSESFPVTVSNSSSYPVSDVGVRINPPYGYYISDVREAAGAHDFECPSTPGYTDLTVPLTCTAKSLAAGASYTLDLKLGGPPVAGHGAIVASAAAPAPDGETVTAKTSHAVTTGDPADMAVTQTGAVLTDGANAGDLGVDITMSAVAPTTAPGGSNAAMAFTIPDGAGFVDVTAANPAAAATQCSAPAVGASGEIDCWVDSEASYSDASDEFTKAVDADHTPIWHIVLTPPPDAGSVTLTATGTSDAVDPDESNNTAAKTYPLAVAPGGVDIAAGFAGGTSAADGGDVTLQPTVTVPDGATATAVTATITLPPAVTFRSIAPAAGMSCDTADVASSGTVTCTAASLGASVTWSLVVSAPAIPQTAPFAIHVASGSSDPDLTNNDATLHLALTGPQATPAVTLTGPPPVVAIGTNVPLTVAVASPVDDFTPTGTVTLLVDGTASGDPVTLDHSGAATVHWAAKDMGPHQLSAHYNGDDSFVATDSATLGLTVAPPGPDATVTIVSSGPIVAGGAGAYTVTLTNAGTEPGTVGELDLTLPDGITLQGDPSAGAGAGFTCTGTSPLRCVPTAPIVLGPGQSSDPVTIAVTAAATATGGVATARVVMAGDVNPDNDTADAATVVTASGLSVSLSGPVTDPLAGQTTQLTVTVGNESAADLAGPTTIDVTLPNGTPAGQHLTYLRSDTPGWSCRGAGLKGVTIVTCRTAVGIPAGTKLDPLPIAIAIPAAALGTDLIHYDARSGDSAHHDQATGTPLALTIGPRKPSHVTATLVGAQELSADGGDYVLDVANRGTGATTGPLTVSVPLPAGVTAQTGVGGPWQCAAGADPDAPALTCTLGQPLFAGSEAPALPVRLTADPTAADTGAAASSMVSLVATVHTADATGPVTGIGAAALHLPPPATPLLQLDSTALAAGSYGLAVHNAGTAPSSGPVTITEQLPAGFTATVDTSGTPWACAQAGGALHCTATGLTIPPGGSAGPPDVTLTGPQGVSGAFALSGQVVAGGTHSAVTGTVAHVTLPPPASADPATSVTLGDSPLYDGEHSTATMNLRPNGSLTIGSDVLFALVLPRGITVDSGRAITMNDDVPEPAAGSITVGFGGGGSVGGTGSGTTSHIVCKPTAGGTAVACLSTFLQADSIGSVTIPIAVSDSAAGTASFYSGIVPYTGLTLSDTLMLNYAVSIVETGGVSAIGSLGLTKAAIRQLTADAGPPQTQVDSTPSETGGQTPTVVDLDASGTTDVGRTLTYGWVQTMGPPVTWKQTSGVLQPGQDNQAAFPGGTVFTGIDADHLTAGPLTAPSALGVKPSFTVPLVATDTVFGFRVYVTDGNTVQTADTTVTITAVADQPPSGTMTARDTTTGTTLTDGGPTPAAGDQIEVTVTTADPDGDPVQTAVSILRPANIGTAIAPVPGENSGDDKHFTFAWPGGAPQLTLQAQMTDGRLAPDGTAVATYATLSVGPAPDPIAVTVTGTPAQPATPGQKVTLTASVTGVPAGSPAPDITWSQLSGPTAAPAPATGASTTVTVPAGVKAGDSIVLQAAAVVGSGADAQAASAQVTIAVAPPPPLAVSVTNFGTLAVATGATLKVTATGSGGTAPYTYKWTKVTGDGTLSDDTKAVASYKAGTGAGFDMLEVTATDANHQTAVQDVPVQVGTAPAATPGAPACNSDGAIGSLFGQQPTTGTGGGTGTGGTGGTGGAATQHYLLKLGDFTVDLGHLDLGGKSCTPDFSISVGGNPGDNITATLGPLTFSHIKATLSMTKLTIASATVATPSEWNLGTVTASNIVVAYDPLSITGSITWADKLPLLSKPGTASSVSTTIALGKDSLALSATAGVAGGTVSATGAISTSDGDFTLHVTATSLKIFDQAFSGSGTINDSGGHVTGDVTVSWSAGKTADVHGLHLTSASLTWNKDGITAQAGATIDGKFTASLKADYDDTDNWSTTVTGGLAADWDITSGLTLKKAQTSLSGTISDKKGDLTFNVAISISGSWTAGPVTLTNLSASFANSTAPKKSCGVVPKDDIYLTIGGKATIAVGSKSIALTAEACIVPSTGAWTIASTATLTGVTLVSDLSLTGISLTVAHQGSQYSAVLVGTATSHGVTGSVQVALIDGSTGLNFLAAATIDISKLGVSIPGCGALIYSTEAISDLSTIPGLDLGLTATPPSTKPAGSSGSSGSGSGTGAGVTTTTAGGTGGCGGGASGSSGKSGSGGGSAGSTGGGSSSGGSGTLPGFGTTGSNGTGGHAFRSSAAAAFRPAAGAVIHPATPAEDAVIRAAASPPAEAAAPRAAPAPQRVPAPKDVIGGTCRSAPVDTPDCFGFVNGADTFCTFLPTDFTGVVTVATCPETGVTPMAAMSFSVDDCEMAAVDDPHCFDVGTDGALCTIDDIAVDNLDGMREFLPTCGDGYLPLAGATGSTGPVGMQCQNSTVDDDLCFGTGLDGLLCTYYPSGFVGVAWLPTCGASQSEHVVERPDGDTSCLSADAYDPSCFAVGQHGQYCTPDGFAGADDAALRELVPVCSDATYRALPAADADDQGQCTVARIDDGTCFGYEVIAQDSYRLCTYYPDDFADVAWLDTCVRGHNVPATQLHDVDDLCAMAVANDPSCFDVDADGTYCTVDSYRDPVDNLDMHQLIPTCDPGAVPLAGAPISGGGGILGCVDAPLDTASCFGFTSDPPVAGGFCTFDPAQFVGIVVIQPCPQSGSVPVTLYDTSADPCYAATLSDGGCFGQNPDDELCSFSASTGGGVAGYTLAEYLPACATGATVIDTGSDTSSGSDTQCGVICPGDDTGSGATGSGSGPGSGPGNTGAAGAANNPTKGIGIPAGFTALGSFTLPVSMKSFLSEKLGLPQALVDSDLVVQANLSGTPVIKATLTAGDGGIVLMHNDSNGTKLTLQSISLTISLGGSFGLSASGGLDLPKPDAKGPADVSHLVVAAAVSIQVSGVPSITVSLSVSGAASAPGAADDPDSGVWEDAFGISGLDLKAIAIQGGIVFSSPPTPSIGFGASIVSLPEPWRKPLGIQDNPDGTMEPIVIVFNISAANPILQISLGVPDGHTFLEPMQPIASILPLGDSTKQQLSQVLQVDDASLIIAPYGGSVGTFTYTPGFHVQFDATMLGVNVNVKADVGISPPAIDAHVDVGAFGFGGLNMDETQLDLSITPTTGFMAHFSGGLSIGGASTTATLDAKASITGGMTFDFESDISHVGYGSLLSLDDLDIFGHGSYTSLKQVPSVTFGVTATAHVLGAGMTVYGDVELGLAGIQGFDIVAAPHPVSLGGVVSVGGTGCNAAALAGLPDVPALPADGPCIQLGYHPLRDPIPTVDINGAVHTSAGIDVAASLTLDDTGLAASGTVQLGPLADVDVAGHLYFGSGLAGVTACDETSVLNPSAPCHQVAVHAGDFVFSAALASQVSLAGMSANLFAGVGHVGNHDWVVGRAALGVLNTSSSPIHGNAAISGAFSHNGSGFHFDLSGSGSITLGGSVTSSGHIIGGYSLASAAFEVSSGACTTLPVAGLPQIAGASTTGCTGFVGTLGQAGGPLPSAQLSGVVAIVGGVLRFQATGSVDIAIAGFDLANASLVAGNLSGPVTVTVSAHAGLGPIVTVDSSASVSSNGNFCISGSASILGTTGGASACTAGEPNPGVKVWFTTYGFSISGYIGPNSFAFTSTVHLNPQVAGTFAGITLSAYADFNVNIGLFYNYVLFPGTQPVTSFSLSADGKVGVDACLGHVCIGPSLDVSIEYNPSGVAVCVGTSIIITDIKICYTTSSGLQVVKP